MDRKERRSSAAPLLLALVVTLALLPLVYVAAIGPIAWMAERDLVNVYEDSALMTAYAPVEYLANNSEVVQASLEWYISFWISPEPSPPQLHVY